MTSTVGEIEYVCVCCTHSLYHRIRSQRQIGFVLAEFGFVLFRTDRESFG